MADKLTFFSSYYEAVKLLPEAERGSFVMGILAYAFDGVEPVFKDAQQLAFVLIKPNIDSSIKRSETNAENASKSKAENERKTTPKTTVGAVRKTTAKTTAKTKPSKDRDMDRDREKEMDALEIDPLDQSISNANASDGAAAAGAAPTDAKPLCPLCRVPLFKNTQTGKFDCPNCFDSFDSEVVAR